MSRWSNMLSCALLVSTLPALGCGSSAFIVADDGDAGLDANLDGSTGDASAPRDGASTSDAPVDTASAKDGASCITCGSRCVDPSTDPRNCGGCGKDCGGLACVSGVCACPASGKTCGGAGCVDVASDPTNCGGCGTTCSDAEFCAAGKCTCRPGLTSCGGGGCVDTTADPNNCGGCGVRCGGGTSCVAGKCVVGGGGCGGGLRSCGGGCVDTRTNPLHCGDCGQACAVDELCIDGRCTGYGVAPFCTTCPCSCGGGTCCAPLASGTSAICVDGGACP